MATDPREAKLPKWTQELLASLRRELDDVRADFEEYADKEMPADAVAVANPYDEFPRLAARPGETVRFKLSASGWDYIDVKVDGHYLDVVASDALHVGPAGAANHIDLSIRRF